MTQRKTFDDLTDVYEAMIDWPKRLANEEPFYRDLFQRIGAQNVVDVACGTGRHAAMFHSWGLRVEGADISSAMVERARIAFGEARGLRWSVRGFDETIEADEPIDAVICVGNSLALAPDMAVVGAAIAQMLAAVREGGAVVVHVLNLWRLPDGPIQWQKCVRTELSEKDVLIIKGIHRCGGRGFVELLVTSLGNDSARRNESVPFLGLEASELAQMARDAGARKTQFFGNYQAASYDRSSSVDLLMVAHK
jgi:glycine/sarcosine N-methyltransferase